MQINVNNNKSQPVILDTNRCSVDTVHKLGPESPIVKGISFRRQNRQYGKIKALLYVLIIIHLTSCGIRKSIQHIPDVKQYSLEVPKVDKINDSTFRFNQNYLTKNKQQLWELYIKGNPLQLGYNNGALTQNLMQQQEEIFFSKVEGFVPSKFKQKVLRGFLKWYNRKMYLNVREDFQVELYGLSRYSSDRYNFIAPEYLRTLYLHGAHDIGHAMQDLMVVGCTSLAVWNENTEDGDLLIGRNFDFYVGDDFARNKVIEFVEPEDGIPYLSVSWPGMIGVVSGMNKEGITVTINAGKSKIPLTARTPISLVTREILQYAATIDEAVAIARKRKVFVSESILVGSAHDKNAVIIEVSPDNFGVYKVENTSRVFCTNHFQSDAYKYDKRNQKHKAESHSEYRYEKLQELLEENKKLDPEKMASVLRNTSGLKGEKIGYGNEKAINQLLAHHAVIFSPQKKLVWVSSSPYQLGEFVCYDLNEIFSDKRLKSGGFSKSDLNIAKDPFADSQEFKNYEEYKKLSSQIEEAVNDKEETLSEEYINHYIDLNPDFWYVYFLAGKFYFSRKDYLKALPLFEKALNKEITTVPDRENIEKYVKKTLKKLK
ncbi:C45 family peptidase [Chryseobacterium gregarium]|uniref:C45 family peptidase n=1 Tax=Chryseobacterium gregarium TaxID=456299 RepID=UPI000429C971|nr:C45 family peptidase [Chryseobacterium gregarium]